MMSRIFLLFLILFVSQFYAVFAQNTLQGNVVKWEELAGKNNEFFVSMPNGFIVTGNANFTLGEFLPVRVKNHIKIARQINGVVLLMDYYEGKSKDIYQALREDGDISFDKEQVINGFQVVQISEKTEKGYKKTHYYFTDKSLFSLKAYSNSENEEITRAFFESVKLVNENKIVAPNTLPNSTQIFLPKLVEKEMQRLNDSSVINSEDADREAIILRSDHPIILPDRPNFLYRSTGLYERSSSVTGVGTREKNASIKVKVLLSSSGKVSNVEIVQTPSRLLEKKIIEAAKKIIFIPAEKNGKLVSVYQNIEYDIDIESIK